MTDIVEELEDLADCDARAGAPLGKAMRKAAAEITRLRAKVAKADALAEAVEAYENAAVEHMQFQDALDEAFAAYRETDT
jgi:hypothetical protein